MPLALGLGIAFPFDTGSTSDAAGGGSGTTAILLEDGTEMLTETGDTIVTEA